MPARVLFDALTVTLLAPPGFSRAEARRAARALAGRRVRADLARAVRDALRRRPALRPFAVTVSA